MYLYVPMCQSMHKQCTISDSVNVSGGGQTTRRASAAVAVATMMSY